MKSIDKVGVRIIALMIFACPLTLAQTDGQDKTAVRGRPVWITLKSGEVYTGVFVKIDNNSIEFKVNDAIQSRPMRDVVQISFVESTTSTVDSVSLVSVIDPTTAGLTPIDQPPESSSPLSQKLTILYQEKARYTDEARRSEVQGTVVLNAMFHYNGTLSSIQVVRGLPMGLTESSIEAAKRIKFAPAIRNGEPVSVRGNLEFTFNLDTMLPAPRLVAPADDVLITTDKRNTTLQWDPVPGAKRYKIRLEKEGKRPGRWTIDHETEVTTPYYELELTIADAWRWKVEAINAYEHDGRWSEWRIVRFTKKEE
jgi:TonB family protein